MPAAFAHSVHAKGRAHVSVRVKDHTAILLAKALRASLSLSGVHIVSMHKTHLGRAKGYMVTWTRAGREGRLFVNAKTGHAFRVGGAVKVRAANTTTTTTTTGVTLSAFLTALETTLASEQGAPVSATTTNNGATTVFTLDIGGQTIAVTVDTGTQSTGTTTGTTGTTTPTTPAIPAPAVSMESAVTAALGTAASLNLPSLTGAFAISATLNGWSSPTGMWGPPGWSQGRGHGHGDRGRALDNGGPAGQGGSFAGVPTYNVVLASTAGGEAQVVESAQAAASTTTSTGTTGTTTTTTTGAAPQLLGIDTLQVGNPGPGFVMAPAVTLDTAVTAAMATDAGAIPLSAQLTDQAGTGVWVVNLLNQTGATGQVMVNASTGQVMASPFAMGGPGQNNQGSQGDN